MSEEPEEREERDTRSYSERYAPPPGPPPPTLPPTRSSDGRLLALIGVGLLVAALLGVLVLRGSSRGPTETSTGAATPTPFVSTGPAPTSAPLDLALPRFWTLIQDPKLSYHVETLGGGTAGSDAYTFAESLDVSGDDWGGTEKAHGLGVAGSVQIVTLDTVVWLKFPDGWHRNIEFDPYFRSRPLLGLDSIRDLSPSKVVTRGDQTLYDLKSTTNYQPYPGRLIGLVSMAGLTVDTLELDILVTADGVPVEATVHILAGGLATTGKPTVDAKATRTFSKVGATFTIVAPKN